MKKFLLFAAMLMVYLPLGFSQGGETTVVRHGSTLPTVCQVGDTFMYNNGGVTAFYLNTAITSGACTWSAGTSSNGFPISATQHVQSGGSIVFDSGGGFSCAAGSTCNAATATAPASVPWTVPNGGTGLTTQTSNVIYKGNGASAESVSSITDNGTTVTTTDTGGYSGPAYVATGPGPVLYSPITRANNCTVVAGQLCIDQDSTANRWVASNNGGAVSPILLKSDLGFGSTVSVFGTAPSVSSNAGSGSLTHGTDNSGIVATGTASTATTVTVGVGWGTWAACTVSASTALALPYVSAISKSAVTFTYVTTGTPALYYSCSGQ